MSVKSSENAAKASEPSRDRKLRVASERLQEFCGPVESVKAGMLAAYRLIRRVFPETRITPNRVRDIWNEDDRIRLRADEDDEIHAVWERWLDQEEGRIAARWAALRAAKGGRHANDQERTAHAEGLGKPGGTEGI